MTDTQQRKRGRPKSGMPIEAVLVLTGYGLRIAVEGGHLVIEDGIADRRRVRRLSRIDRQVKRIAIIGHAGTISLDAIRWLHDVKVPLVHLDTDGRVLALVAPDSPDHPTLRRAQARAADSEIGVQIARRLLHQKVNGQERMLRSFTAGQIALPQMELGRRALDRANDYIGLRAAEARAAAAYWSAWTTVRLDFQQSGAARVPEHWRSFGQRASPLAGSPRLAVNPANAMLNYLYAILEAEARLALLAVGCDPGIGIQHADQRSRDSMACDVMEAIRPEVDAWLFRFLEIRTLRRQSFFELRNGQCRLMPDLAKELAQTSGLWALKLSPVVEELSQILYESATRPGSPSRWSLSKEKVVRAEAKPLPTPLTEKHRRHARPRSGGDAQPGFHSQHLGKKERQNIASTRPTEPQGLSLTRETFLRDVIPTLRGIPIKRVADAVGLSEAYCAKIRSGRGLPHRTHWESFARLAFDISDSI